jgi:hypothetical protein
MALTLNDVLTLGKMGFTKTDIAALMGAQPATQSAAIATPATAPAAIATPATAPAAPDYGALVAGLADLSAKVSALSVPSAGVVGSVSPETSIEDIILSAYQPKQADAPAPDFMKGVNK